MLTKEQIYDSLLKYQVDFSMEQELTILRNSNWDSARKVLDYGCGNAYYLSQLEKKYPDKEYWGCDKNPQIVKCTPKYTKANIVVGEYPSISVPSDFDFVVVRYLTSYLANREEFFQWIKNHSSEHASLLIVDAYDNDLIVEPYLPLFMKGQDAFIDGVEQGGGCRDIRDICQAELIRMGYSLVETKNVTVNSRRPFDKEKIFSYMCLIAEMDNDYSIPADLGEELISWLINPNSFLQYGTFASLYQL